MEWPDCSIFSPIKSIASIRYVRTETIHWKSFSCYWIYYCRLCCCCCCCLPWMRNLVVWSNGRTLYHMSETTKKMLDRPQRTPSCWKKHLPVLSLIMQPKKRMTNKFFWNIPVDCQCDWTIPRLPTRSTVIVFLHGGHEVVWSTRNDLHRRTIYSDWLH